MCSFKLLIKKNHMLYVIKVQEYKYFTVGEFSKMILFLKIFRMYFKIALILLLQSVI